MKTLIIIFNLIVFSCLTIIVGHSQPHPQLTIPINLSEPNSSFFDDGGTLTRNLKYEVEVTQNFNVSTSNPSAGSSQDFFLVINSTHSYQYSSQAEFEALRSLGDNESIKLRIEQNTGAAQRIWNIEVNTTKTVRPNSSFAYVSAIRSIDGVKADSEIFDFFGKFNLNLGADRTANAFTMAGVEFNFSEADTTSSTEILNEAMFSVNYWLHFENDLSTLTRSAFVGLGSKVFDQRIYVGGHLGIMEVQGGFFTTYLFAGYYHDLYTERNPATMDMNGDPFEEPRSLKNNIYTEFSIQADGLKVPILSDIRLKVGILYPFKGKRQTFASKPTEDDIKHRILLEVPLDKVFKF